MTRNNGGAPIRSELRSTRRTSRLLASGLLLGLCTALLVPQANAHEPIVAGYLENAWFVSSRIVFEAKLDTGANSSSLNAKDSQEFSRDGKRWVKVRMINKKGETFEVEAPVKKTVKVRRAGASKQERLVIELPICVAGHTATTDFTLANRSGQSYQVLIGRRFMTDRILVRSSSQFITSGRCNK